MDFFLVKPDVETGVGFLKMVDFEIVDQNIRKDGAEMLGRFHPAKIALYSDTPSAHRENPLTRYYFIGCRFNNRRYDMGPISPHVSEYI